MAKKDKKPEHSDAHLTYIPATEDFELELRSIIENFSISASLLYFTTYADACNYLKDLSFVRQTELTDAAGITFGVGPIPDDDKTKYNFSLIANESCLYQVCREELTGKKAKEKLSDAEKKIVTYADVLQEFIKKYKDPVEGYQRLNATMRYIMMHEALHILLAHSGRTIALLRTAGMSMFGDEGKVSQHPLVASICRSCNIIQDAFINLGLDVIQKHTENAVENALNAKFYSEPLSSSAFRKEAGHLFRFNSDTLGGVRQKELVMHLEDLKEQSKTKSPQVQKFIDAIKAGKLLEDFVEEDICEIAIQMLCDIYEKTPKSLAPPSGSYGTISLPSGVGGGSSSEQTVLLDEDGNVMGTVPDELDSRDSAQSLEAESRQVGAQLDALRKSIDDGEVDHTGSSPGVGSVFGRSLKKITEVPFPWERAIEGFVGSLPGHRTNQSWAKLNLAYAQVGIKYPGTVTERKREDEYAVGIVIDASGSMSNDELAVMLGAVIGAAGCKIQKAFLIFHDWDFVDLSEAKFASQKQKIQKYRKVFDQKLLKETGVLAINLEGNRRHSKTVTEFLGEVAKDLPQGGTSHVKTFNTLLENDFFSKIKEKMSGLILYTDCESDLERLPPIIEQIEKKSRIQLPSSRITVVNSQFGTGSRYTHEEYRVMSVTGEVFEPTNPKMAAAKQKAIR